MTAKRDVRICHPKMDLRSLMPEPVTCRYCHCPVRYCSHAEIYGGRTYSDWPYIYLCTNRECRASIGVHRGTRDPLGTMADKALKAARVKAHAAFDPLWKEKLLKREEAYRWLAAHLDIERWRCHISWFEADICAKVEELCAAKYLELRKPTLPVSDATF